MAETSTLRHTPQPGGVERFRSVLGNGAVDQTEGVWRYACGGVVPSCVLLPETVEQVSAAVRLGREEEAVLVPAGNGTHLHIGFPPRRYDAALSVRRLNRVVAHDAADMTVTVEAGLTLSALDAQLQDAGQWLPVDPPQMGEMTVGGLIAADRAGPLRLSQGKVRDMLIGVKAVIADGTIVKGGGRVVKNVAGYDLPKLFAGSYGTLGVIIEATFKVRPRPPIERLFVWRAGSIGEAADHAMRLVENGALAPAFLEALNPAAAEMMGICEGAAALVIGCAGSEREVEAQQDTLAALARTIEMVSGPESDALRKALCGFPQPLSEDALVARVSVLPATLGSLLERFEVEAQRRGLTLEIQAHAGSGVAWCQLAGPLPLFEFELWAEWMRIHTRAQLGWVVFESLPAGLRDRIDPWGFSEPSLLLMKRIKQTLDPTGVFSPGRFVGAL